MLRIVCILSLLSVIFFASSALADGMSKERTAPLSDVELLPYNRCNKDRECIYVQNGCCDCANGGKDAAINKSRLADFKKLFKCHQTACTMMAAVPECGSGVVSCIEHRCRYFTDKEFKELGSGLIRQ